MDTEAQQKAALEAAEREAGRQAGMTYGTRKRQADPAARTASSEPGDTADEDPYEAGRRAAARFGSRKRPGQ